MWQRHREGGPIMMTRKIAPEMLGKVVPPMRFYDYFEGESDAAFKAGRSEFCLENSWHLAEAGLIAYEEPNFIRNVYMLRGFDGFRFFENPPSEAFVAWKGKTAIAAFRGTELKSRLTLQEITADASFTHAQFLGGYVHKGFKERTLALWEGDERPAGWAPWASLSGMKAFLERLLEEHRGMCLYLTGHSLGAAMATIAAALFPRATALYTFGSPMVGDRAFANGIAPPHYRWVNDRDIVTYLPPSELMSKMVKYSYAHCGQEKFLDAEGRLTDPPAKRSFAALMSGDSARSGGALSQALAAIEKPSGRSGGPRGRTAAGTAPLVEVLIDHAPVRYAVNIWNLMC